MTVKALKAKIAAADARLDDDTISNAEFDKIEQSIKAMYAQLAKLERTEKLEALRTVKPDAWFKKFLEGFEAGAHKISSAQYAVIMRNAKTNQFNYNGRTYNAIMGSVNGSLYIEKI